MASMFEPLVALAESVPSASASGHSMDASDWNHADVPQKGFVQDRRYGPSDRRKAEPPVEEKIDTHAADLEAARAEGERVGLAAAREELAAEKMLWGKLKMNIAKLDEQAQEVLAQRLRELVAALCERTLQPLALDTDMLAKRCDAAAQMMGETASALALHIHPDDCASLDPEFLSSWSVQTDPEMVRGTLRFCGAEGEVTSGPAEWRAAIADAIGLD